MDLFHLILMTFVVQLAVGVPYLSRVNRQNIEEQMNAGNSNPSVWPTKYDKDTKEKKLVSPNFAYTELNSPPKPPKEIQLHDIIGGDIKTGEKEPKKADADIEPINSKPQTQKQQYVEHNSLYDSDFAHWRLANTNDGNAGNDKTEPETPLSANDRPPQLESNEQQGQVVVSQDNWMNGNREQQPIHNQFGGEASNPNKPQDNAQAPTGELSARVQEPGERGKTLNPFFKKSGEPNNNIINNVYEPPQMPRLGEENEKTTENKTVAAISNPYLLNSPPKPPTEVQSQHALGDGSKYTGGKYEDTKDASDVQPIIRKPQTPYVEHSSLYDSYLAHWRLANMDGNNMEKKTAPVTNFENNGLPPGQQLGETGTFQGQYLNNAIGSNSKYNQNNAYEPPQLPKSEEPLQQEMNSRFPDTVNRQYIPQLPNSEEYLQKEINSRFPDTANQQYIPNRPPSVQQSRETEKPQNHLSDEAVEPYSQNRINELPENQLTEVGENPQRLPDVSNQQTFPNGPPPPLIPLSETSTQPQRESFDEPDQNNLTEPPSSVQVEDLDSLWWNGQEDLYPQGDADNLVDQYYPYSDDASSFYENNNERPVFSNMDTSEQPFDPYESLQDESYENLLKEEIEYYNNLIKKKPQRPVYTNWQSDRSQPSSPTVDSQAASNLLVYCIPALLLTLVLYIGYTNYYKKPRILSVPSGNNWRADYKDIEARSKEIEPMLRKAEMY